MNTALRQAEQHDLAGRHDDAVNALAKAVQGGDLDATAELGKRLLIGDRAPRLPEDGANLLADAARAGHADGALRLATLAALGAHVPQSWSTAFGLLALAAEHGSESARGQLRTLAGRAPEPRDGDHGWRKLVEHIDLGPWLTPPASRTLSPDPLVQVFPNFISDEVVTWLIERARPHLKWAHVDDAGGG